MIFSRAFLSYRRADSAQWVGRIYEGLTRDFLRSQLFVDVDYIGLGADFAAVIAGKMAKCSCFVCIIGRDWMGPSGRSGSARIFDQGDFVRIEVEAAIKAGIPIIPVLVDGATIPAANSLPPSLKALATADPLVLRRETYAQNMEELRARLRAAGVSTVPAGCLTVAEAALTVTCPMLALFLSPKIGEFLVDIPWVSNAFSWANSDAPMEFIGGAVLLLALLTIAGSTRHRKTKNAFLVEFVTISVLGAFVMERGALEAGFDREHVLVALASFAVFVIVAGAFLSERYQRR